MTPEVDPGSSIKPHFLRRILLHSLAFGATTTIVPIILEIVAALLIDRAKVGESMRKAGPVEFLVLAVFFLVGAFVGAVRFAMFEIPRPSEQPPSPQNRKDMIQALGALHVPAFKSTIQAAKGPSHTPRSIFWPILQFLEALGMLDISSGQAVPVSQTSDSFILSLVAHLRDGNTSFAGDWRSGPSEPEARRLTEVLRTIEEYRIQHHPTGNPQPARVTRAAISLIRADFQSVPKFLMIKSYTWDPAGVWTPVMGGEEPIDCGELVRTVRREIQEEMRLQPEEIVDARELAIVKDKRISKRLGLYSEYTYGIYAVQLRQASAAVQNFFVANPKVSIDYFKAVRVHEFTWLTWDEVLASVHLCREMPTVIQALKKIQPGIVPQTVAI